MAVHLLRTNLTFLLFSFLHQRDWCNDRALCAAQTRARSSRNETLNLVRWLTLSALAPGDTAHRVDTNEEVQRASSGSRCANGTDKICMQLVYFSGKRQKHATNGFSMDDAHWRTVSFDARWMQNLCLHAIALPHNAVVRVCACVNVRWMRWVKLLEKIHTNERSVTEN